MTTFSFSPFRTRSVSVAGLLVASSLVLTACGGAVEDDTDTGATPDDTAVDVDEPDADADAPEGDADADDTANEPAADADADPAADAPSTDPADASPADTSGGTAPATEHSSPAVDDPDCSGQGESVMVPAAEDLPAEVLATRDFLIDAALRCDEQLLYTAMEESDAFTFTFGSETDAIGMWWDLEDAGDEPFLRIAQVLATTPALADGGDLYVWPQVHTGRPENTTDAAWEELVWVDDPAAAAEEAGGYLDWRIGISTDGQWRFFVRGD